MTVQSNFTLDAWLFGGAGDDTLSSGRGDDVLSGGEGSDTLTANRGRDLLFGRSGVDSLNSGHDDDVLVSGTSTYETDEPALAAIMAEWTSSHSFAVRKANLQDGSGSADRLNDDYFLQLGRSVFDDGANDSLNDGNGSNWGL